MIRERNREKPSPEIYLLNNARRDRTAAASKGFHPDSELKVVRRRVTAYDMDRMEDAPELKVNEL